MNVGYILEQMKYTLLLQIYLHIKDLLKIYFPRQRHKKFAFRVKFTESIFVLLDLSPIIK